MESVAEGVCSMFSLTSVTRLDSSQMIDFKSLQMIDLDVAEKLHYV